MKPRIPVPQIKIFRRLPELAARLNPVRRMLALEIAGDRIIGAVAEAKGKRLSVRNFVVIDRSNAGDDLPDPANIRELMDRLDYPSGPVVLITPLARSVQITMNRAKVDKLRDYQLRDALRWEVEPYTGITGTQAMIGAERGGPAEADKLLLLDETEAETDVNVSAIEQNVYRAMKQLAKRSGLKLVRLYPPEVCFFMPLFLDPPESAQAVFDIGQDYANFTIVKGRQPKQINTYPLGRDVLLELIDGESPGEAEQSLGFLLRQAPGPLPLLLTGIGATLPNIVEYLNRRCEYGARPLELTRSDKLGRGGHEGMNAMYAIAAGAAVRELLGRTWRNIGICDVIPLPVRVRRSAYLVPLGVAATLAVSLFGHYLYMKNSKERYRVQTEELQAQTTEKQAKFDAYNKLKGQQDELAGKMALYKKQIAFLKGGFDDNLIHIEQVLLAFFHLPERMRLDSIAQEGDAYLLQGETDDFAAVGDFSVALQKYAWCRAVHIKALEQKGTDARQFRISLETVPEKKEREAGP